MSIDISFLEAKAKSVRRQTLKLHRLAPGTRVASSLSAVEIFVALYYGKILHVEPANLCSEERDRFVISKAHGSISLYPILADLGFFPASALDTICQEGSFLGSIPDPTVPAYETMNGSLGHGLGVACGMAVGLDRKKSGASVFILMGDGELYEGSVWEAVMFASQHRLDRLLLIIDSNKACMLDYCKNVINLEPLEDKFRAFGWDAMVVDGHSIKDLYGALGGLKHKRNGSPKVLIANTIKGKGVPQLEDDPASHFKVLSKETIDKLLSELP